MRISDWSSDVCSSDLPNHRRPITALLVQALQLAQGLGVMWVTIMHGLQRTQRTVGVAAVHLQLCVRQGNRQLSLGLTLKGTFQQAVALLVKTLLIGRPGGAKVIQQWLALGFGGTMQVPLGTGPATFGQVQLTVDRKSTRLNSSP